MMIKNFKSLAITRVKKHTLSILEAGLEAASPDFQLKKIIFHNHLLISGKKLDLKKYHGVYVVAIGKAAYSMAKSVNSLTMIKHGLIVVPRKTKTTAMRNFEVIHSGHPLPDKYSIIAAKQIFEFVKGLKSSDFVIFLISGGASSLVALPDGITLKQKQIVTNLMQKCGSTIHEINCVRKHLSKIKGGRLIEHLKSEGVSLVMSDVVGDDLDSIGSGITYCDKTRFIDAKKILEKYHLESLVPKKVLRHIDLGIQGKIPETPKNEKIKNYVILTNNDCLKAMNRCAKDLGYSTKILNQMSGNVKDLSMKIVKILSDKKINCIIFGGEPTVVVKGKGKGGRNQELVLYITVNLTIDLVKHNTKAVVSSIGTDGIDGNTDCAGAIWNSDKKIDRIISYLNENDSYNFFKKYGGLIFTGPTGTNLMDIGLVIRQ